MKNVVKSQEQALQTMQESIPPPPAPSPAPVAAPKPAAPAPKAAPAPEGEQGASDPNSKILEAITRNNQLLQDLLGGMGNG